MTTIKAIETQYAGCRFRSRLEARWAVAFNASYVIYRWEYEPEGFDLDGLRYLPDFRLWWTASTYSWVEVKPDGYQTSGRDHRIYQAMAREAVGGLYLLSGIGPGYRHYDSRGRHTDRSENFLEAEDLAAGRSARFEHGQSG